MASVSNVHFVSILNGTCSKSLLSRPSFQTIALFLEMYSGVTLAVFYGWTEQQKIKISFACRKTKGTQCQSTLDPVKTLWLATTRCQTAAHSSTSMTDVCLEGLMLLYTEQWAQRAVWSMPLPSRVLGLLGPDGITCCLLHNLSLECASNVALWFKTHFILVDWSHW
jgi:hypothetical protein